MNPLDQIMSAEEAAKLWNLAPAYVKNLCREGKINAKKVGRDYVIDKNQPNPSQPTHPKNWRGRSLDK